jgi:hypothetical protein
MFARAPAIVPTTVLMPMPSFIVAVEGDDSCAVEALLNCTVNVAYGPGTAVMLQTADEV